MLAFQPLVNVKIINGILSFYFWTKSAKPSLYSTLVLPPPHCIMWLTVTVPEYWTTLLENFLPCLLVGFVQQASKLWSMVQILHMALFWYGLEAEWLFSKYCKEKIKGLCDTEHMWPEKPVYYLVLNRKQ